MLCFQYFPVRFFRMSHDVNNKHPPASRRFGSSRNWAFAQLGVGLSDITPATTLETFFSVIIAFRRAPDFFSGLTDGSYGGLIWWLFFYDMGMTWEFSTFSFHDWSSKVYPLYIVYPYNPYIQGDVFLIPKFPLRHRHRDIAMKTQWWSPIPSEVFDYLHHIDQSDDLADDRIDQDQRRRGRTEAMLKC